MSSKTKSQASKRYTNNTTYSKTDQNLTKKKTNFGLFCTKPHKEAKHTKCLSIEFFIIPNLLMVQLYGLSTKRGTDQSPQTSTGRVGE